MNAKAEADEAFKSWALEHNWPVEAVETNMPNCVGALREIFQAGFYAALAASPVVQRPKPHNHEIQTDQINWRHTIEQSPVAVLYTGSIDGEMVGRDDIWLAKTSQLAASPLPQVDALDGARWRAAKKLLRQTMTPMQGSYKVVYTCPTFGDEKDVDLEKLVDAAMKQGSN